MISIENKNQYSQNDNYDNDNCCEKKELVYKHHR